MSCTRGNVKDLVPRPNGYFSGHRCIITRSAGYLGAAHSGTPQPNWLPQLMHTRIAKVSSGYCKLFNAEAAWLNHGGKPKLELYCTAQQLLIRHHTHLACLLRTHMLGTHCKRNLAYCCQDTLHITQATSLSDHASSLHKPPQLTLVGTVPACMHSMHRPHSSS